jgi:hypothetical protein
MLISSRREYGKENKPVNKKMNLNLEKIHENSSCVDAYEVNADNNFQKPKNHKFKTDPVNIGLILA